MAAKPWHYKDAPYADIFWGYAEESSVYDIILRELEEFSDVDRERDNKSGENLMRLAKEEIENEDNYLNRKNKSRSPERLEVLSKIEQYEREGRFFEDVEADPPSKLLPENIDYLKRSFIGRMKRRTAYKMARKFVHRLIREKKMIIKEIRGEENLREVYLGAVLTCNHFNAFDSFAMQIAYEEADDKKRTLYRVIKEGNYTSFPGFYGNLMRNCNTLPLASNHRTLKKFIDATETVLREGQLLLVYPEQSMWYNYRKPKPLKLGAFQIAVRAEVPVVPCFITMRDSEYIDEHGFPTQEYTINIGKAIYPDASLSKKERAEKMMRENYDAWKKVYEDFYGIPLIYNTEKETV